MDMLWPSNSSNLSFVDNGFEFNETSLFDEVTNSTDDPHPPSSSSDLPSSSPSSGLSLAYILIIFLACYLLTVFLLTSLHSCSTRHGLAAECCMCEPDTPCACRDICSDLCATRSQCCSCRCSCSTSPCTDVLQYYFLDECRMCCKDCVGCTAGCEGTRCCSHCVGEDMSPFFW